jgi:hypothetical protein
MKASPGFQHPFGIMPKACQDSCGGTGIMPEASHELKQPVHFLKASSSLYYD